MAVLAYGTLEPEGAQKYLNAVLDGRMHELYRLIKFVKARKYFATNSLLVVGHIPLLLFILCFIIFFGFLEYYSDILSVQGSGHPPCRGPSGCL